MQVHIQRLSPVLVEFAVQIGADQVRIEVDKAFANVAKSAKIRGFRPGKAPKHVLLHLFGARIAEDVAQRLVEETFPTAVSEHKLRPVAQPAIESQKLLVDRSFSYKARVEVLPEIASVTYDGLEAKRPVTQISDEVVDKELERMRRAQATLEPLKVQRPTAEGDVVIIDLTVDVDGSRVEDASATDFQAELGTGNLIREIEVALTGKSQGETALASVDLPASHPHPKLRGKLAQFSLVIKDIKERVLPAADDEFAKDIGDFETLDALKQDLRTRIEKRFKDEASNKVAEQLVLALVKANPIPVPPSLVEQQMRISEQEILNRARSQGQPVQGIGDELRASLLADSEVKVRAGLLMAEIAKKEGVQVTTEELEEGLKDLAEQTGKNIAKLRVEYREPKKQELLIGMLVESKVLDIIEAKAKIEDEGAAAA